ncbi:MAG: DUF2117 domain-containing protein [Methanomicrobiales archaeon]|nr:DUF2117 domain-containing protein [Methanomicrobiales archaeon]
MGTGAEIRKRNRSSRGREGRGAAREDPLLSRAVMVVHGPEAFDAGDVSRLRDLLSPPRILVAGVMARTAAEESGLPVTFCGEPPSRVIPKVQGAVYLVNRGKTAESGRFFGEIVARRLGSGSGLVQVECGPGLVYVWNRGDRPLADAISRRTGFPVEEREAGPEEKGTGRLIRGCRPGEAVFVNGIVIGTSTEETVVLRERNGVVEPVRGLVPKPHGLEKLTRAGPVDLRGAWCKSGMIRQVRPRAGGSSPPVGMVQVVDHCGVDLYRGLHPGICGVLAIGDDTTAVCGHICAHRGVPVLGIVDRDSDGIVREGFAPGSVVVDVVDGTDDALGAEVAAMVPDGPVCWDEWVEQVLARLGDRVRVQRFPTG